MWLIEFLPNWVFHLVLFSGVLTLLASFALKFIPFVANYRLPLVVGGVLLTSIGLFLEGAIFNEDKWQLRVAEAEKRALEAEAKSSKENVKLVTKTVEKLRLVRDHQVVVEKEIVEKAAVIDSECRLPADAIKLHNKAATRPEGLK